MENTFFGENWGESYSGKFCTAKQSQRKNNEAFLSMRNNLKTQNDQAKIFIFGFPPENTPSKFPLFILQKQFSFCDLIRRDQKKEFFEVVIYKIMLRETIFGHTVCLWYWKFSRLWELPMGPFNAGPKWRKRDFWKRRKIRAGVTRLSVFHCIICAPAPP